MWFNKSRSIEIRARTYLLAMAGGPFRALVRRSLSERLDIPAGPVPVYLIRNSGDLRGGQEIVSTSLELLEQFSPIWHRRLPTLSQGIMCLSASPICAFNQFDRYVSINPWYFRRTVAEPFDAAICLAGNIVYALAIAYVLSFSRGDVAVVYRHHLCSAAAVRFMRHCLPFSKGPDVGLWISALKENKRGSDSRAR